MHYDIAAKVLLEKCREEILRRFLGLSVRESTLLEELPQETVSLKRTDFPLLVTDETGSTRLVLLEIQSRWDRKIPLRLLEYRSRYLIKYGGEVLSCVLLLKSSAASSTCYEDSEVTFRFKLIPIYEQDARRIIEEKVLCLLPFVPLMKHGEGLADRADELLYESALPRGDKADMLTVMTILSGLVSRDLPRLLLSRRRDIMIESAAYDLIKEEGIREGLRQGLEKGLEQGLEKGKLQEAQEAVLDILEARFQAVPRSVITAVRRIDELRTLKTLLRKSGVTSSLDEFKEFLQRTAE